MKIYVEEAVFSLLPRFNLFCLQADVGSFLPGKRNPGGDLKAAVESVKGREKKEEGLPLSDPLEPWREAFKKFTADKGASCSLNSLLSRARAGTVESMGPVDEAVKAVSLYFSVPISAMDLSKVRGFLGLCLSRGRDPFLDEEKESFTREGEVCYMDKLGAASRCINWKISPRLKANEESRKILFLSESVDADSRMRTAEAVKDLDRRLQAYFEAKTRFFVLDVTQMAKRI